MEELTAALVDAIGTSAFDRALIDLVACDLEHNAAAMLLFPPAGPPRVRVDRLAPGERATLYGDYLAGVYRLSPFYRLARQGNVPAVARIGEIAPDNFKSSEYYRRYFGPIGVQDMLGVLLAGAAGRPGREGRKARSPVLAGARQLLASASPASPALFAGSVFFISLSRGPRQRPFARADVERLRKRLPVLVSCLAQHLKASEQSTEIKEKKPVKAAPASALTLRESEVVDMILEGHSTKSIAARLRIAVETVRVHRRHIYEKLGVTSQGELFNWFINGLEKNR